MALILNQIQQTCMSDAVKLLNPADAKLCELEVELCLILLTPVYLDPPQGNPTKARKQLTTLDSSVKRFNKVMNSLDPAAEGVLHDVLEHLREAQELLVTAAPQIGTAADALSPRKQGEKVNWDQRMLVRLSLELFEHYRPGEAKPTLGAFKEFLGLVHTAVTDSTVDEEHLLSQIKWAYDAFCANNRRVPDL